VAAAFVRKFVELDLRQAQASHAPIGFRADDDELHLRGLLDTMKALLKSNIARRVLGGVVVRNYRL